MSTEQATHVDILIALAKVEGKIDSLTTAMAEKRADITSLDVRVRSLEQRPQTDVAKADERVRGLELRVYAAVGAVALLAFLAPFLINAMDPSLRLMPGANSSPIQREQ